MKSKIVWACPTPFCRGRQVRGRAFAARSILSQTKSASSSWGAERLSCLQQQELRQRLYPSRKIRASFK